jgi:hydroxymethylpyrimidine/phosphomethylpyrimidine kinase
MSKESRLLIIAGFDPSGGAGIVADLETIHKLGGKVAVVITSITIQNSEKFKTFMPIPAEKIAGQLEAIYEEFRISGVKIGMLGNRANAIAVAEFLEKNNPPQTVLDPIYKSSTGTVLNDEETIKVMKSRLFPHITVITPNMDEALHLADMDGQNPAPAKVATHLYDKFGLKAVIITGNESKESKFDLVYDGDNANILQSKKVKVKDLHGTGCRYSSALAYYLSKGIFLNESALLAKDYILDYLNGVR